MKRKDPKVEKIREEMGRPIKPDYRDVGTCLRYKGDEQIFRSKFKNAEDAQNQYNRLLNINVVDPTFEVYKCPECGMWHFGKKEWANV